MRSRIVLKRSLRDSKEVTLKVLVEKVRLFLRRHGGHLRAAAKESLTSDLFGLSIEREPRFPSSWVQVFACVRFRFWCC